MARYFPPASKARIEAMVHNIKAAFGKRIDALDWMAPSTRAKAKAKLDTLDVGVGYPDHWVDYSGLEVVRGDAFGNAQRAELFEYRRHLAKLGRPVDRGEWVMTPQTVNAVNLPVTNALDFPAAILQPPFFDPARPVAMDYGAIGATIGHEISHSFDDARSLFDAEGRLRNWWTDEDRAHFEASSAKLVKQYDAYVLSLGGRPAPVVAGLTGDQQFFLSFGQSWRTKTCEAALRQQILQDSHAPDEFRADTVRNLDPWYDAFAVKPGQALYLAPADRVRVW